jgi:RNA recognition motif-containing protein
MYIGNLPYNVSEDEIRTMFSEYGVVDSIKLITDKFSGQSKGFGFIEMSNNSEADKAIKALNKTNVKGRDIKVNQAEPQGKRPQRKQSRY